MATLGVVYDAEPAPRRPHDVIAVPGGGAIRPAPANTLTPRGEVRFVLAEPNGQQRWVDVSQIPLPEATSAALDVAL